MGLPNLLNDVPRYDAVLPSNGEKVKFRPFLVKEQKVLMMAAETRDSKAMVKSMTDCVSGCVEG
ncbi:MAG TPA: baseplate protein, partial [Maribacter sp.]|nr:baseplate protein [Maribacter sp.]